jgi:NADPH2:quinone reductase
MTTMRAVVLDAPGPAESLTIRELPVPAPAPGWVLIRVTAFGLNRSELHTMVPLARTFTLDGIVEAHTLMEHGSAGGKLVVVP